MRRLPQRGSVAAILLISECRRRKMRLCHTDSHRNIMETRFSLAPLKEGRPMKNFMVLYMADHAEVRKNSTPEQQKKGMDAMDEVDGRPRGIAYRWRRALGKGQAGRLERRLRYRERDQRLLDRPRRYRRRRAKDHPHLHLPRAWVEIIEIMPPRTCVPGRSKIPNNIEPLQYSRWATIVEKYPS
jgi:hypothetical protein